MLGFLFGTVCLIALVKLVRHHHGYGYGYGWAGGRGWGHHHGGWGQRGGPSWGGGPARGRGYGPPFFLRAILERLETTPGQEKVIVEAVDEIRAATRKAREELRGTRSDFAQVVRGPVLDESTMTDIFVKHDTTLSDTRRTVVEALRKIHDALTEEQRARVADVIERGPGGFGGFRGGPGRWGGGPYRQWL